MGLFNLILQCISIELHVLDGYGMAYVGGKSFFNLFDHGFSRRTRLCVCLKSRAFMQGPVCKLLWWRR